MRTLTRRTRRLASVAAGLAAACALAVPAAAQAATGGYAPNSHEWYFGNWSVQQDVWPVTEGSGVTVAVVDSGVQASLPDLQGAVKPGGDMLGSGNGETDYAPDGGHGTEVSELIAGQGIGGGQFGSAPVGLAPQAKILPVHVVYPNSDAQASLPKGIRYAVDHGAGVINLSVGQVTSSSTSCDASLQQAIGYALAHNVVVVAGSGDRNKTGNSPLEPGTCAGVLTAGGVEPNGSLWPDSTQGPQVSVAAPADHIYVTSNTGQQYTTGGNGTSYAAPLVSAAAALIRSKYPSMPWYQIDQRLIDTAVASGSVPNNGTGYGIINVNHALNVSQYPVKSSAPNPPYERYQAWLKSTGQGSAGSGGQSAPSKGGGSSSLVFVIIGIVVVVLILAVVLIIVLVGRGKRRGSRGPGGGYPATGYAPPPGQYPQHGRYTPPGQYPPPQGQQYPPPGQYPPPRQ